MAETQEGNKEKGKSTTVELLRGDSTSQIDHRDNNTEHCENSPKSKTSRQYQNSPRSRNRRKKQQETAEMTEEVTNVKKNAEKTTENVKKSTAALSEAVKYSLVDMFFYVFYLPLFCTGPLLTYDQFQCQVSLCFLFISVLYWNITDQFQSGECFTWPDCFFNMAALWVLLNLCGRSLDYSLMFFIIILEFFLNRYILIELLI